MSSFTPIHDVDQKLDVMDHVNQDHTKELLAIAKSHYKDAEIASAKILDIFQEGIKVNIGCLPESMSLEKFIPFEIEGDLEDKILYLAYSAIVKQGGGFSGNGKRFFEVIGKETLTENMVRVAVKSASPLPDYYPGYAYAFLLKSMKQKPNEEALARQDKSWSKGLFDRFFIWLMKHLSSKNRQKLLQSANKDVRLYTLRKSWKNNENSEFSDHGYIDIFKHDNTAGSLWADGLSVGDIIMSRSEAEDKHPHLANGQALLIADETAFPALAGILEHWQNALPPYVILLSSSQSEQQYFSESDFPKGTQVHRVVCEPGKQSDEVMAILAKIETIESVWAAFESESAKKIRHYLRNSRQVVGKNNHTKAYWNMKSKRGSE